MPELSAFDSVAAGFVAAEAEEVSDPNKGCPPVPGPTPAPLVACAHSRSVCCLA